MNSAHRYAPFSSFFFFVLRLFARERMFTNVDESEILLRIFLDSKIIDLALSHFILVSICKKPR